MNVHVKSPHDDQFNVFVGDVLVAHVYRRWAGAKLSLTPTKRHRDRLGRMADRILDIQRTIWDSGEDVLNAIRAQVSWAEQDRRDNVAAANYVGSPGSRDETRPAAHDDEHVPAETNPRSACVPVAYERL